MPLDPEQLALIVGETTALVAAVGFYLRAVAKSKTLKAQSEHHREETDTRTRELVNEMTRGQAEEIRTLRAEVTALQVENARYRERETMSTQRFAEMQTRIDNLIESTAAMRVTMYQERDKAHSLEQTMLEKIAEKDRIISDRDATIERLRKTIDQCECAKQDYTS